MGQDVRYWNGFPFWLSSNKDSSIWCADAYKSWHRLKKKNRPYSDYPTLLRITGLTGSALPFRVVGRKPEMDTHLVFGKRKLRNQSEWREQDKKKRERERRNKQKKKSQLLLAYFLCQMSERSPIVSPSTPLFIVIIFALTMRTVRYLFFLSFPLEQLGKSKKKKKNTFLRTCEKKLSGGTTNDWQSQTADKRSFISSATRVSPVSSARPPRSNRFQSIRTFTPF